jgi:hypothetical protein
LLDFPILVLVRVANPSSIILFIMTSIYWANAFFLAYINYVFRFFLNSSFFIPIFYLFFLLSPTFISSGFIFGNTRPQIIRFKEVEYVIFEFIWENKIIIIWPHSFFIIFSILNSYISIVYIHPKMELLNKLDFFWFHMLLRF